MSGSYNPPLKKRKLMEPIVPINLPDIIIFMTNYYNEFKHNKALKKEFLSNLKVIIMAQTEHTDSCERISNFIGNKINVFSKSERSGIQHLIHDIKRRAKIAKKLGSKTLNNKQKRKCYNKKKNKPNDIHKLNNRVRELEKQNDALIQKDLVMASNNQKQIEKMQQHHQIQINKFHSILNQNKQEIMSLSKALNVERNNIKEQRTINLSYQNQLNQKKQEIMSLSKALNVEKNDIKEQRTINSSYQNQIRDSQQEIKQLQTLNVQHKKENDALKQQLDELRYNNNKLLRERSQLNKNIEYLQMKNTKKVKDVAVYERMISKITKDINETTQRNDDLTQKQKELHMMINLRNNHLKELIHIAAKEWQHREDQSITIDSLSSNNVKLSNKIEYLNIKITIMGLWVDLANYYNINLTKDFLYHLSLYHPLENWSIVFDGTEWYKSRCSWFSFWECDVKRYAKRHWPSVLEMNDAIQAYGNMLNRPINTHYR